VIGAGETRGIAAIGAAQAIAAMAADIQKGVYLALAVAHHQDGVLAHIGGEEVARLWYLALVAQEQPAARENPLQLLLVDLRLDEDAAADQAILGIDQSVHVHCHRYLLNVTGMTPVSCVAAYGGSPRHRPSGWFR